jgi:plasmid stability protein
MSQILIRNLSSETVDRLKEQAKRNKRSLEAEVRQILEAAAIPFSRTSEYRAFQEEIAAGRNKVAAFRDYSDKVRAKSPAQKTNSTDIARRARDDLSARG